MTAGATGRAPIGGAPALGVGRGSLTGRWSVVADTGTAGFAVRDKLVTTVHGTLPVTRGAATVLGDGTLGGAWLELDVAGVGTGNARRDRDLRKARFLDAEGHPTIRVEVRESTPTVAGWTLSAVVAARGHEAPVELVAEVIDGVDVRGDDASGGDVRVVVRGQLDRTPLEIGVPTFVVGRVLDLEASLVLRRLPRAAG